MNNYIISDLVMENSIIEKIRDYGSNNGVYSEEENSVARICRLMIATEEQAKKYGYRCGRYITVYTRELWRVETEETADIVATVSHELRTLIKRNCRDTPLSDLSVLVVGIGNRKITPDGIGPATIDRLMVTRHLKEVAPSVFRGLGRCSVSAISCGVMGDTGMQSLEIIKGITDQISPNVVLAVDSLCAKNYERLAATVQLSDNGIVPGAGIGQGKYAVDREHIGIPVIAIGVPTVVSAATLIEDAVRKSGQNKFNDKLISVLEDTKGLFVAPKECDLITSRVSDILARAIDDALCVISDV